MCFKSAKKRMLLQMLPSKKKIVEITEVKIYIFCWHFCASLQSPRIAKKKVHKSQFFCVVVGINGNCWPKDSLRRIFQDFFIWLFLFYFSKRGKFTFSVFLATHTHTCRLQWAKDGIFLLLFCQQSPLIGWNDVFY